METQEAPQARPSALPEGCTPDSYYRSEARPLHELKPHWKDLGQEISFIKWLNLRDRARKDLFWLGKSVLKKDLTRCHLEPCRRLFVQKNFDGAYRLGYTIGEVHAAIQKQARKKEMLWLDPRGAFKSTLDGIDAAQWMLNCPDIRILILTGEYKLALAFMSEIKGYFYRAAKAPASLLHKLFPEYILEGKAGTSDSPIECPARIHNQKEPSLWVNAIVANLSGWHCDIRKMDDVVTDENSNSVDARGPEGKLKMKVDGTDNLVDEWGFTDIIGTRYYVDDYYGQRMKIQDEAPLECLVRQCWTLKQPFIGTALQDITEDMVDLLFPEKLTFASLRKKLRKNERMFRCQQLNEPAAESDHVSFTEAVLDAHLVASAPADGDVFTMWDTSFAHSAYSDFSAGAAARIVPGKDRFDVYILEVIFGRWKPSELAYHYVQFEKKWNTKSSTIERPADAELLQIEIAKQAKRYEVALHIIWKTPSNAPDAKRNQIKGMETLLSNDMLWFVRGPWIEETFNQFVRYTGERGNRGRKDDIPDAISKVQYFCPFTEGNDELLKIQADREKKAEQQAVYRNIFDSPIYQPPQVERVPIRKQLFGALAR